MRYFFLLSFFLLLIFSKVKTLGLDGEFNLLNIGSSNNINKSFKIRNNKILISTKELGLLEHSKDLNIWYGVKRGKRFIENIDAEKAYFRFRKLNPRPVQTYVPKNYDPSKKYPLIINIHGFTGDWKHQNGYFPLKEYAEKYGFIFCVPDGEFDSNNRRRWNAIDACCGTRHDLPDDSTYLRSIIDHARKVFSVDESRIYSMGFSNGGMMSYRMAIDHSDILAGIVVVGGISFKDTKYSPKFPIHVLHVHGTLEENFHGTKLGDLAFYHAPTPSVQKNILNWSKFNNCEPNYVKEEALDLVARLPGNETKIISYTNKENGCDVELWQVKNGVHVEEYSKSMKEMLVDWMLEHPKIKK